MAKKMIGIAVLSTLVVAGSLWAATPSFAQGVGPGNGGGNGNGSGMGNGGGMGMTQSINAESLGIFEDVVDEALADFLGISVAELEAAHDEGLVAADLAERYGVDLDDLMAVMAEARADAIADAVADGLITAEQGAFLLERVGGYGGVGMNAQSGATNPGTGYGPAMGGMGRGMRQGGQGLMGSGAAGTGLYGDCTLAD